MSLKDKVIFMSGGSRGIGLAMAKKAAQDGAKVVIAAKLQILIPNYQELFMQQQMRL